MELGSKSPTAFITFFDENEEIIDTIYFYDGNKVMYNEKFYVLDEKEYYKACEMIHNCMEEHKN